MESSRMVDRAAISIGICGTGISGRTTTMSKLVEIAGDEGRPAKSLVRGRVVSFQWLLNGREYAINLCMIRALSNYLFNSLQTARENEWASSELDLLSDCNGLLIVLDAQKEMKGSNLSFLSELKRWLCWCDKNINDLPISFFINKCDVVGERRAKDAADELGLKGRFLAGSAITGEGVRESFDKLVATILALD